MSEKIVSPRNIKYKGIDADTAILNSACLQIDSQSATGVSQPFTVTVSCEPKHLRTLLAKAYPDFDVTVGTTGMTRRDVFQVYLTRRK